MTGDGSLAGFVYHHQYGLVAGRGEQATIATDGKRTVENLGDPARLLQHFKTHRSAHLPLLFGLARTTASFMAHAPANR
jgi:hypothetical protein